MSQKLETEIGHACIRLERLMRFDIAHMIENYKQHPYCVSVLIEVLIHLDFLLLELGEKGSLKRPIIWSDDIPEYNSTRGQDSYKDITSLIHFFRNAACHLNATSKMTFHGQHKVRFVFQKGLAKDKITPTTHLCKYDDDIAILMGHHVLYVKRHIKRAYNEALEIIFSIPRFVMYKEFINLHSQKNG